jgi:SAM-dependent methyltransferase
MLRVPEPELMDDPEQARAYAAADFSEANGLFVDLFAGLLGGFGFEGHAVDLGCGPADIPLRLARRYPALRVDAVDGSAAMLAIAREALAREDLLGRVRLRQSRLPVDPLPEGEYDAVISNSLLHHLHDPSPFWRRVRSCARAGAPILVMDLKRPATAEERDWLVERYAGDAPAVLRRDFRNSLAAAFTLDEVRAQLVDADLGHLDVRAVSDRHLAVSGAR